MRIRVAQLLGEVSILLRRMLYLFLRLLEQLLVDRVQLVCDLVSSVKLSCFILVHHNLPSGQIVVKWRQLPQLTIGRVHELVGICAHVDDGGHVLHCLMLLGMLARLIKSVSYRRGVDPAHFSILLIQLISLHAHFELIALALKHCGRAQVLNLLGVPRAIDRALHGGRADRLPVCEVH